MSTAETAPPADKVYLCLFDLPAYDKVAAPGLRWYVSKYDPAGVVALLQKIRELLPELKKEASRPLLEQEDYEHWIVSIAPDAGYKPSEQTVRDLCGLILPPLCIPHGLGFRPMQDLVPLSAWLSARSEWFADLMEGGEELSGGRLEFSFGSNSLVATRQQIARFALELADLPAPEGADSELAPELENLRKLVRAAVSNENYTLLKTTVRPAG